MNILTRNSKMLKSIVQKILLVCVLSVMTVSPEE